MKKRSLILTLLTIILCFSFYKASAPPRDPFEKKGVLKETDASPSHAAQEQKDYETLFPLFRQAAVLTREAEGLPAGAVGELLSGEHLESHLFLYRGREYVLPWGSLSLLCAASADLPRVCPRDIEEAVLFFGMESETHCLLWTDLSRLETYLLQKEGGAWRLCARLPCSAGDGMHPTPRGRYRILCHAEYLGREGHRVASHVMQFSGDYLYHSVPLFEDGITVRDGRLGERISRGCIRLSLSDAAYLYHTVPDGTGVYIR